MSSYEYLALVALIGWCGTHPPGWHPPLLNPEDNGTPVPWFRRSITNLYYFVLAGISLTTVVTHKEQAFSASYGLLIFVPILQILEGLYSNNAPTPPTKRAKQ
jgi:hypothetical protein